MYAVVRTVETSKVESRNVQIMHCISLCVVSTIPCRSAVAVSPLPLGEFRKLRKNTSNAVNGVNGKTFPVSTNSVLTRTGNGTERNYSNGTAKRQPQHDNGTVETRHWAYDTAVRQRVIQDRYDGLSVCTPVHGLGPAHILRTIAATLLAAVVDCVHRPTHICC